jgi:hypothetical protein
VPSVHPVLRLAASGARPRSSCRARLAGSGSRAAALPRQTELKASGPGRQEAPSAGAAAPGPAACGEPPPPALAVNPAPAPSQDGRACGASHLHGLSSTRRSPQHTRDSRHGQPSTAHASWRDAAMLRRVVLSRDRRRTPPELCVGVHHPRSSPASFLRHDCLYSQPWRPPESASQRTMGTADGGMTMAAAAPMRYVLRCTGSSPPVPGSLQALCRPPCTSRHTAKETP